MQRTVSDNDISALYNPYNGVLLLCLKIGINYVVEQWEPPMWTSWDPSDCCYTDWCPLYVRTAVYLHVQVVVGTVYSVLYGRCNVFRVLEG